MGSSEARCDPGGIISTGEVHAVKSDYTTLCGAAAVFVFVEREFHVSLTDPACPSCSQLALTPAAA
ncbi:MAG TPA: hypothetical protein VHX15_11945 [Frankiaceae bacterium]|nr:hypothetical protein [Frankiaceae bacterium]